VTDFAEIAGGSLVENQEIVKQLVAGTATQAQQDFLAINAKVAAEFFDRMRQVV